MDRRMGSGQLRAAAEAEVKLAAALLTNGAASRALCRAAALAAGVAGWTAFDDADQHTAADHYRASIRLASRAEDAELVVYFSAQLAHQQISDGQPYTALRLLETVLGGTAAGAASPPTLAAAHTARAHAHARLGDPTTHARAMNDAHRALAQSSPHDSSLLNAWVDTACLWIDTATHLVHLGQPHRALDHFRSDCVTDRLLRGDPRKAVFALVHEARAHLGAGDLDAAITRAHQAVDHLNAIQSRSAVAAVIALYKSLATHQSTTSNTGIHDLRSRLDSSPLPGRV
ncbi:hypothetical protein [Kitasatospora sp. NPDC094011]|uniref:hypothetical protein n=1 Tax=Kitasatospora sp. NPDC094011 TaxID=3364090 RepID=UPI0038050CF3